VIFSYTGQCTAWAFLGFFDVGGGNRDAEGVEGEMPKASRADGCGEEVSPPHRGGVHSPLPKKFLIIFNEDDAFLCILIRFYAKQK